MRSLLRPLLIVTLALLVPIVPFLGFGEQLEAWIAGWFDPPPSAGLVALLTVAILSIDIFLPVPSSVVSTVAGAQSGILLATAASWLGMTVGAALGFALAKWLGRPLASRLSSEEELDRMDRLAGRYGASILMVTRALPVLAEAAVLVLGVTQLPWRKFLPAVMLSNLGIALVYALLGHFARSQGELPLALTASIALPLMAMLLARRVWR